MNYQFFVGLDLGQANDFTALVATERTPQEPPYTYLLRYIKRFPLKTSYPDILAGVSKIVRTAPHFASMKEGIAKGQLHDLDISKEMGEAALTLSKLKESKTSVADHLAQRALFGEGMSPMAKDMLEVFDQYSRKPKQLGEVLRTYAEMVDAAGSPAQSGMFATHTPTKAEILEAALRKKSKEESDEETPALFGTGTRR